jgi:hypothetical protein
VAAPVSVTSQALRSMSPTAWNSQARPINAVRGAGMEGTDLDGSFCSRRSSSRPTTEFWHHTIAFRSLPNIPPKDQGAAPGSVGWLAERPTSPGPLDLGSCRATAHFTKIIAELQPAFVVSRPYPCAQRSSMFQRHQPNNLRKKRD